MKMRKNRRPSQKEVMLNPKKLKPSLRENPSLRAEMLNQRANKPSQKVEMPSPKAVMQSPRAVILSLKEEIPSKNLVKKVPTEEVVPARVRAALMFNLRAPAITIGKLRRR